MSDEQIKFRQISAKLVGSNVVSFRLEDETLVKVHVELGRVGVAVEKTQMAHPYTTLMPI